MEALSIYPNIYKHRNPREDDLHKIIRENYLQVIADKELADITLPFHIKREFRKYIKCGILAHGFARFNCKLCNKDKLVAFSCKGRTICPSCSGRRMADTAKHLVENVIPKVPIRQWVLSMPYKHRFLLSRDSKFLSRILAVCHRAISSFYTKKAKAKGLVNPKVGAISIIQRFGGALNLNIHFHSLFMDGVYYENEYGGQCFFEIIPTDQDILDLVVKIKKRINRCLDKREQFETSCENNELDTLKSQSVLNLVSTNQRPELIGKMYQSQFEEFAGKKCAYLDGFSLHANVKIPMNNRSALEKLCRYVARGAIPKERVTFERNQVLLKLKTPYSDGTTHLKFTPEQFIRRIIALIPPPRQNFIRYYGVFGARHRNRKEITSKVAEQKKKTKKKVYRTPWAELLKRVFKYEVDYCDSCGGKLQLIASITSPVACRKILNHLGLDSEMTEASRPRGPPPGDLFDSSFEDVNQEYNW